MYPNLFKLDVKMAFADQRGVMLLFEELISFVWPSELGKIQTPFPCLTYEEAVLAYDTYKPDIGRYLYKSK